MPNDVYPTGGHLTVRRDLNNHTNLCEVWELEHLAWIDGEEDYDIVKCHIARINDIPFDGVPHADHCVSDSCSFDEAPEEVQLAFLAQIRDIQNTAEALQEESE